MLSIKHTNSFLRDVKKIKKRGKDITKLYVIVEKLANGTGLEKKHKPHPLKGEWLPCWECHIEPDWLLVYETTVDSVMLIRTGTHSDLFD